MEARDTQTQRLTNPSTTTSVEESLPARKIDTLVAVIDGLVQQWKQRETQLFEIIRDCGVSLASLRLASRCYQNLSKCIVATRTKVMLQTGSMSAFCDMVSFEEFKKFWENTMRIVTVNLVWLDGIIQTSKHRAKGEVVEDDNIVIPPDALLFQELTEFANLVDHIRRMLSNMTLKVKQLGSAWKSEECSVMRIMYDALNTADKCASGIVYCRLWTADEEKEDKEIRHRNHQRRKAEISDTIKEFNKVAKLFIAGIGGGTDN